MTPRGTFVIPVFNGDAWLSDAIFSCRDQSVKNIEIIVVNDGSTDGSSEVVNWHAKQDPRVVAVHFPMNMGRSNARNRGNEMAKSPYIFVLDADDLNTKNRVKESLLVFENTRASLIYGSFFGMDAMGNVSGKVDAVSFNKEIAKQRRMNYICHSTMAYKKELALNVSYDQGEFSHLGLDDWKFQWDAFHTGAKFAPCKKPLAYHRILQEGTELTRDQDAVNKLKESYLATF